MKRLVFVIFLVLSLIVSNCSAQFLQNKIFILTDFGRAIPMAKSVDDFTNVPYLFSNYSSNYQFCFLAAYRLNRNFYAGLAVKNAVFSNWDYSAEGFNIYSNSKSYLLDFSPTLIYYVPEKFAKLNYGLMVKPTYSFLEVRNLQPTFEYSNGTNYYTVIDTNVSIKNNGLSLGTDVFCSYKLGYNLSLSGSIGYSLHNFESMYYMDNYLNQLNFRIGLIFELKQNKLYRYD